MNKIDKVAKTLLRPINPTVIIVLGVYTIIWGLWIINPFWTVFTTASVYSAMMSIAPEWFWGGVAIISGMFVTRGALKPSFRNLQLGAFIGFFHWLVIGILYFVGDWMNTGGITAITFATYSALVWVNIKINRANYSNDD
jgi:hypothetical protein